mmetsp:Transcript_36903/g.80672  ORF Transcript_36903/g.80672 Transcript_36903/m.80672 type:complete len:118 (+) Transcript_36903:33-386(+)
MDRSQPYGKGKGRGKGSARSWRPRPQRIAARVRPQVIYDTRKYDGTIEDFVERLADTLNCFSDSIERSPPAAGVIELKANGCCVEFHEVTHCVRVVTVDSFLESAMQLMIQGVTSPS